MSRRILPNSPVSPQDQQAAQHQLHQPPPPHQQQQQQQQQPRVYPHSITTQLSQPNHPTSPTTASHYPNLPRSQAHHDSTATSPMTPGLASSTADGTLHAQAASPDEGAMGSGQKPTYAKRGKITVVACVPCRKRKTKCDGKRPACSQCASRDGPCHYDMTDEQRKLTVLRDNVEQLREKFSNLESLLNTVQSSSDEEAKEVFRRLRTGNDLQVVADQVQAGRMLSGVSAVGTTPSSRIDPSLQSDPSNQSSTSPEADKEQQPDLIRAIAVANPEQTTQIINGIKSGESPATIVKFANLLSPPRRYLIHRDSSSGIEANFSHQDQTFGMMKGADVRETHATLGAGEFNVTTTSEPWTRVTNDAELVEHFLDLYFAWQHSFFQNFPEKLFRSDMKNGRTKYCSSMLVNAICANGAYLSSRRDVHRELGNGKTIVDSFFEEALDHLEHYEQPSITTTASLYLISYVAGTKGRLSDLWQLSGRSALMAQDINLHLKKNQKSVQAAEEEEEEARNEAIARQHAFWGCFHVDQMTAFTLGKLPNFDIHGVTVDMPAVEEDEDQLAWSAYDLDGNARIPDRPSIKSSTFSYCASLSSIVNSTLRIFFAPAVPLNGNLLLQEFQKYLNWYQNLPPALASTEDATPHVLCLHMYYHTAILLLFRPFLKARIHGATFTPRDVCRSSAEKISNIWAKHTSLYGYQGIYMFQVHCLLTATTIHIIGPPSITPTKHLTAACNAFHALSDRNEWAKSCLTIIRGLVTKWELILPQEAEMALLQGQELESPKTTSISLPALQEKISPQKSNPPHHVQATDPATAYRSDPLHEQSQNSLTANLLATQNDLPLPPPAGFTGSSMPERGKATSTSGTDQNPSKRSFNSHNSMPSTVNQKRQRIVAPTSHVNDSAMSRSTSGTDEGNALQEQQLDATSLPAESFLYAPLMNQPAPILSPVHTQAPLAVQTAMHQQQGGVGNIQSGQQQATSPITSSGATVSGVPATGAIQDCNTNEVTTQPGPASGVASAQSSPQLKSGSAEAGGQSGNNGQGQQRTIQQPRRRQNQHTVEGLTFEDDWRDPFMGFLENG